MSKSFTESKYSPSSDRTTLLIDNEKNYHVISVYDKLFDRFSPLTNKIEDRKWQKIELGGAKDFQAFNNSKNQAAIVYQGLDFKYYLTYFNPDFSWAPPVSMDPYSNWPKEDKIIWWKIVNNGGYQFLIVYHKSSSIRVYDVTDGQFTLSKGALQINYLQVPKENIDATLDDKNIIHIAAINKSNFSIYHFTIKP